MPPWSEELEEVLTETVRRLVLDALVGEDRLSEDSASASSYVKTDQHSLRGLVFTYDLTLGHGGGFSRPASDPE